MARRPIESVSRTDGITSEIPQFNKGRERGREREREREREARMARRGAAALAYLDFVQCGSAKQSGSPQSTSSITHGSYP